MSDPTVSEFHAIVTRKQDGYYISDNSSTNGIHIDSELICDPVLVTVGMEIHLGDALLIGVDENGRIPVRGYSLASWCQDAERKYGGASEAARRISDVTRDFLRRRRTNRKRNGN